MLLQPDRILLGLLLISFVSCDDAKCSEDQECQVEDTFGVDTDVHLLHTSKLISMQEMLGDDSEATFSTESDETALMQTKMQFHSNQAFQNAEVLRAHRSVAPPILVRYALFAQNADSATIQLERLQSSMCLVERWLTPSIDTLHYLIYVDHRMQAPVMDLLSKVYSSIWGANRARLVNLDDDSDDKARMAGYKHLNLDAKNWASVRRYFADMVYLPADHGKLLLGTDFSFISEPSDLLEAIRTSSVNSVTYMPDVCNYEYHFHPGKQCQGLLADMVYIAPGQPFNLTQAQREYAWFVSNRDKSNLFGNCQDKPPFNRTDLSETKKLQAGDQYALSVFLGQYSGGQCAALNSSRYDFRWPGVYSLPPHVQAVHDELLHCNMEQISKDASPFRDIVKSAREVKELQKLQEDPNGALLETPDVTVILLDHTLRKENGWSLIIPLGALLVSLYIMFVTCAGAQSVSSESKSLSQSLPEALPWMIFSLVLSIFNKWIFTPSGGGFPFPVVLTCAHMLAATVVIHSLKAIQPSMVPGLVSHGSCSLVKSAMPVGAMFALSVMLANCALHLLSVKYVNLVKCGNPMIAFGIAMVFRTTDWKSASFLTLVSVLLMFGGVIGTTIGEAHIHIDGIVLLLSSVILEQIRLVFYKRMLSSQGLQLDSLSALGLFAPVAFVLLIVPVLVLEGASPPLEQLRSDPMLLQALALNLLISVALNVAFAKLLKVASPLTFTVFGTGKDTITAFVSMQLLGGKLSVCGGVGYVTTLAGMLLYEHHKHQEKR